MNGSMIIAAVGMRTSQQALEVAAHNIANADTVGFKRREASFEDVLAQVYRQPPGFRLPGRLTPLGLPYGWGANVHQLALDFRQGPIEETGRELDFALEGDGLFEILVAGSPQPLWTRAGAFEWAVDPDDPQRKVLTTPDGAYVLAEGGERISVPAASRLLVDAEGRLYEVTTDGTTNEFGRLSVVRVVRPELLVNVGDNRFTLAEGAAEADVVDRVGVWTAEVGSPIRVRQRALEQSNVRPADEMVDMLAAQRAFQLQARAFATAEQMLGLAVSMRG